MNSVKLQDTKPIHRNNLHSYTLTMKNQKVKLRNQSHLPLQPRRIKYLRINLPKETNGEGNGNPLQYSCLENPMEGGAWCAAVHGVAKSRTRLSDFTFTFHFHALEKKMATHSSVLAWRIPGTGEPGGLPSLRSHRVGHDWSDLAVAAAICKHIKLFNYWTQFFFFFQYCPNTFPFTDLLLLLLSHFSRVWLCATS